MNQTSTLSISLGKLANNTLSIPLDSCGWVATYGRFENHSIRLLDLCSYPVFLLIATVGNVLNLIVLTGERPFGSKNVYLVALALTDVTYMWCALMYYITSFEREIYQQPRSFTKRTGEKISGATQFIQEVCDIASAWLIVAFTMERFMAIRYPLQHLRTSHGKRGVWVVGMIFAVGTVFAVKRLVRHYWYYYNFLRFDPPPARPPPYPDGLNRWYEIYRIAQNLNQLITFLTILTLNVWLLILITQQRQVRRESLSASDSHDQPRFHLDKGTFAMLAACVMMYLVTQTPAFIDRILEILHQNCILRRSVWAKTVLAYVNNFLLNINYSFNFVLYCGANPKFRQKTKDILCCFVPANKNRRISQESTKAYNVVSRQSRASFEVKNIGYIG